MNNPFPTQDSVNGINVAELAEPNCRLREDTPVNNAAAASKPQGEYDPDSKSELMKYGYVPFYRAWTEASWFAVHPWSAANLFLWFYANANRVRRHVASKRRTFWLERGCVTTSIKALAERSGLDPKTVRRMIREFEDAGELKLEKCGVDGIVARLINYDRYALDSGGATQRRDQVGSAEG